MINRKVDATRERILEAAAEEFADRGFEGGRVARIAATARVNKQLLFHYFGSKAGLYRAVLIRAVEELEAAWKLGSGPVGAESGRQSASNSVLERLRQQVEGIFAVPRQQRRYVRLVLLDLLRAGGPQEETQDLLAKLLGVFKQTLSEGQGLGFFRDDANPDVVASHFLVAPLGYLALEPAGPLREAVGTEDWARETADLWWRALTW